MKQPNPFAAHPLSALAALTLCKVPEMPETHERRKPRQALLSQAMPMGGEMAPAAQTRKARPIVIERAAEDEKVMH